MTDCGSGRKKKNPYNTDINSVKSSWLTKTKKKRLKKKEASGRLNT